MSKEWMFKTLISLGFTETDAQLYIHLVKKEPQRSRDIADSLKISQRKLYPILKKLQRTGIVKGSLEYPTRFSAIPFEKLLDLLLKDKMKQQQSLEDSREKLLLTWQKIMKKEGNS